MLDKYKTVVLYTLNMWENALPRLRLIEPLQEVDCQVIQGNHSETVSDRLVQVADVVVIQRDFPRLQRAYESIRNRAKTARVPIVFELDDLLLELPENGNKQENQYYRGAYFPIMQALLDADAVTCTTQPLCDYLKEFNPNTYLLPNFLPDRLWSLHPPKSASVERTPVAISYIGGDSHTPDIAAISPALTHLLDKYDENISIHFLEAKPPAEILDHPQVKWNPVKRFAYQEFAEFVSKQNHDIFIAPLANNLFNRCKSSIKFLEYSALGAPGVFSELPPYERVVEHGVNGFLAADLEDWKICLEKLIENPDLRYQMAVEAQETVRRDWLLSNNAYMWEDVYESNRPRSMKAAHPRKPIQQTIDQFLLQLRFALFPPGSLREQFFLIPLRTLDTFRNEGLDGVLRKTKEKFARPSSNRISSPPTPSQEKPKPHPSLKQPNFNHRPHRVPSSTKASLIILTHNNRNYTRLCLNSIYEKTTHPNFEVILVDNASSDGTPELLKTFAEKHSQTHLILNKTNLGFARGNNQGAQAASGDVLVFLNNDIVVTKGWLSGLLSHLEDPQIGMVGPVTNASGNESRIEVHYRNLNELERFAREHTRDHIGSFFEIPMLAFFCVAVRREVFQEVGGLDERYEMGMFEDDDFAMSIRSHGYRIICAQDVFIHHWGSASFSKLDERKFFMLFKQNRRKFEEKWGRKWQRHQLRQ